MSEARIRIAVQKSGRLSEDSIKLLKNCDLSFELAKQGSALKIDVRNYPLEILFLRDDDIPGYVADGVADIGIAGENVVVETGAKVETLEKLQFSRCRLALAVPKGSDMNSPKDLEGKKIATSYPALLGNWLKSEGISAEIHSISGSVEIAPGIGLTDAICDLVSSGSTLVLNGLREIGTVFRSQAVLVGSPSLSEEKNKLVDKLRFRIQAVEQAKSHRYILLNAPDAKLAQVLALLPGLRSPTVVPLAETGWSSVHTVLKVDEFWEKIEQLREAGAEGILVSSLEKMVR